MRMRERNPAVRSGSSWFLETCVCFLQPALQPYQQYGPWPLNPRQPCCAALRCAAPQAAARDVAARWQPCWRGRWAARRAGPPALHQQGPPPVVAGLWTRPRRRAAGARQRRRAALCPLRPR